ncbi:MAG: hypothetical protein GY705_22100 [Bacteroidetes bacterium]|nr:hypothetical protein [Bacteroidota bacterium]
MSTENVKKQIHRNSKIIKNLHDNIHETFKDRDKSKEKRLEWENACSEFHKRYDSLAFPGGYNGALERIIEGDPNALEAGLCFLECRPYFFRSGYMYKDILRKLKKAPLNLKQENRLKIIIEKYDKYREERRTRKA